MDASALGSMLKIGIDHHRAGRLAEAEAAYRAILAAAPDQPDAMQYLGVIAHQSGQSAMAIELIGRAAQIAPTFGVFNNLGEALRGGGRTDDAIAAYQHSIRLNPNHADAPGNLGTFLATLGRFDQAAAALARAVRLNPNQHKTRRALAQSLEKIGKEADAIEHWERAVSLDPADADAAYRLGQSLLNLKRPVRAAVMLGKAAGIEPRNAMYLTAYAKALAANGQFDAAVAAARAAMAAEPIRPEPQTQLALVLDEQGDYAAAERELREVLARDPRHLAARVALGGALDKQNRVDDSFEEFKRALELVPTNLEGIGTLAATCRRREDYAAAIEFSRRGVQLYPGNPDAHGNYALSLLAAGDYENGWREYEWRWRCGTFTTKPREFEAAMWDGSEIAGRSILVHAEQGFGDVIQFARYVPLIVERGAKVTMEVHPSLRGLMTTVDGNPTIISAGLKLPRFDLQTPLLSLPAIFKTTMATIPAKVPYLRADEGRRKTMAQRIEAAAPRASTKKRIGLIWAGNKKPDPRRTIPLAELAPALAVEGIAWFSLQKGEKLESSLATLPPTADGRTPTVHDLAPACNDFADTAAAMAELDLIVTIDTGPAHLAGALGRPTWMLLTKGPDWRWFAGREDSPWYPTMRLFRAREHGVWRDAVEKLSDALIEFR